MCFRCKKPDCPYDHDPPPPPLAHLDKSSEEGSGSVEIMGSYDLSKLPNTEDMSNSGYNIGNQKDASQSLHDNWPGKDGTQSIFKPGWKYPFFRALIFLAKICGS